MRKRIALVFVFLFLLAVCAPAFTEAAKTQTPAINDLASVLSMTRADVTALIGQGEALPFADISDYHESAFELGGFPYVYSTYGVMVFYDAVPQADGAVPYGCVESPGDRVLGIMLQADSPSCNVAGFQAGLSAEAISALKKEFHTETEHVTGMYEYYRIRADIGGVQYVWVSDQADMSSSALYASLMTDAVEKTKNK